ncbi:hypothetical protein Hdeb2414_s0423g00890131 [Helianthus debilis subsp. tardiflorus]
MHPYRPPFGGPARPTNPNTTQPQTPYNLQDMDPSFLSYAAYLSGAPPFVPTTYGFGQAGGSQPSQPEPESEPDVEVVPEFLSKPINHLQGDALILAQMRRQKIREKYGL